jgi:chemotaxis protein CheZ
MEGRWADLFAGKLSSTSSRPWPATRAVRAAVSEATEAEKARLLEIMMAQDFQDITGQLIKKVVTITKTVENELAQLLRDSAPPTSEKLARSRPRKRTSAELMSGPSVPSAALDQDSVDDLLADLGF